MKTTPKIIQINTIFTNPAFPVTPPLAHKMDVSDIPLLVFEKTIVRGNFNIITYEMISGHARLAAAQKAGHKEISCLIVNETPELIENLQRLDWAHSFGEHGILKHPDAYAHYKKLKGEYLQRELPPELLTQQTWEMSIKKCLIESLSTILAKQFGEGNAELIDALLKKIDLDNITAIFSKNDFKIEQIPSAVDSVIALLVNQLPIIANQDLNWINVVPVNLSLPSKAFLNINRNEASTLLNNILISPLHTILYEGHAKKLVEFNRDGLVTKNNYFYERIAATRQLRNDADHTFTTAFLSSLMSAIRQLPGNNVEQLYRVESYRFACRDDYTSRLQDAFNSLYEKIHHDAVLTAPTKEYIENCFDELNIIDKIYKPLGATQHHLTAIKQHHLEFKKIIVAKILLALEDKSKVSYHLKLTANNISKDVNTPHDFTKIIRDGLNKLRKQLIVNYQYADSDCFQANSSAELLGILLLMQRSYKHFVKNKIAANNVYLKKRQSFSVIKDFLSDNKHYVTNDADGITHFMFMIKLATLGSATTELKITHKGKCEFHVKQFEKYLNQNEAEVCLTGKAMLAGYDKNIKGSAIDQTLSQWMGNILKLESPTLNNCPDTVKKNILRFFCVYVFMMFYIEGLRNPAAFVIHPTLLQELITQPLEKLNDYIVNGNFVMTPVGSKSEGEKLHSLFQPKSRQSFIKSANGFTLGGNNMAERSINTLNNINPATLGTTLLTQFNLRRK